MAERDFKPLAIECSRAALEEKVANLELRNQELQQQLLMTDEHFVFHLYFAFDKSETTKHDLETEINAVVSDEIWMMGKQHLEMNVWQVLKVCTDQKIIFVYKLKIIDWNLESLKKEAHEKVRQPWRFFFACLGRDARKNLVSNQVDAMFGRYPNGHMHSCFVKPLPMNGTYQTPIGGTTTPQRLVKRFADKSINVDTIFLHTNLNGMKQELIARYGVNEDKVMFELPGQLIDLEFDKMKMKCALGTDMAAASFPPGAK